MILIGNGRLIKHTSNGSSGPETINTPEIQSLIGRAIAKKYLPFGYGESEKSLSQLGREHHQHEKAQFVLNLSSARDQPEIAPYSAHPKKQSQKVGHAQKARGKKKEKEEENC